MTIIREVYYPSFRQKKIFYFKGEDRVKDMKGIEEVDKLLSCSNRHVAICGGTGAGKTMLAKAMLIRRTPNVYVLDWGGEYRELPIPSFVPPFPLPFTDFISLVFQSECLWDERFGVAVAVKEALKNRPGASLRELVAELKHLLYSMSDEWFMRAKIETLAQYFKPDDLQPPARFDLSAIKTIIERICASRILSTAIVLSRPVSTSFRDEIFLVIERGELVETPYHLKSLVAHARNRKIRIIFIANHLPPHELRDDFVMFLSPAALSFAWARELGLPSLPPLKPGEFIYFDGKIMKKIKLKLK